MRKMAAALLLLICAGAMLNSVEAQDSYVQLSNLYKKGVDLVVEQLRSHSAVPLHYRFLRSLDKSDIEFFTDITQVINQCTKHPKQKVLLIQNADFLDLVTRSMLKSGFGVSYVYHQFLLKPTTCSKQTTHTEPHRCPFRDDKPMMDCAVCYKAVDNQIENNPEPYVHCIQRRRLTKAMIATRKDKCTKMSYTIGGPSLLAVRQEA